MEALAGVYKHSEALISGKAPTRTAHGGQSNPSTQLLLPMEVQNMEIFPQSHFNDYLCFLGAR